MMSWLHFLFWLATFSLHCKASNVIDINFDNYYSYWKNNEVTFVEFYAPWCGHCKQLTPKWEELADRLKGEAVIAKVDATEDLEFAEEYDVKGYPALKLFKKGAKKPVAYEGPREVADLEKFVRSWLGDCPKKLKSADEVTAHLAARGAVLGLFKGTGKEYKSFVSLAKERRAEFSWAVADITAVTLPEALTQPGFPSVRVTSSDAMSLDDIPVFTYTGPDLEKWLSMKRYPLLGLTWKDDTYESEIAKAKLPVVQTYVRLDSVDLDEYQKNLESIAQDYEGKAFFSLRDASKHQSKLTELGIIEADELPRTVIANPETNKVYVMPTVATTKAVKKFVVDFFAGKLRPFLKSQPAADGVTVDGLTTMIGSTFHDQMAQWRDKDVFIEFYAPWCGHCKSLAPIWEKVAKDLEAVDTIVIAKLDSTANDWDDKTFPVSGYPTLYFRPAAKVKSTRPMKPLKYSGAREEKDIVEYIRTKATHPIPAKLESKDEL